MNNFSTVEVQHKMQVLKQNLLGSSEIYISTVKYSTDDDSPASKHDIHQNH